MTAKQYIHEITERSCLPRLERKRIQNDLENEITTALERGEDMDQIIERMGKPDDIAAGLFENFMDAPLRPFREYKSVTTLFGLPLVHIVRGGYSTFLSNTRISGTRDIKFGGRYSPLPYHYRLPAARGVFAFGPRASGIVAIGNLAAGFISIGNFSVGVISIGNLAAGLFTLGNLALAALIALGNLAIGTLSAGNVAFGYAAAGNYAAGIFAVGNKVSASFAFSITNLTAQREQIQAFFAGLEAPAPTQAFFGMVEWVLLWLNNPLTIMPLIIISSIVLLAIIMSLVIIPRLLLNRARHIS